MVFDTASMYFRSFFGLPSSLRAPDGTPVNAVRGLLDAMASLVAQYRPTHLACAWDNDWRPAWRVALVPSYKTHRLAAAVPSGHEVVGAGGQGALSGEAETSPDELAVQIPVILDVLDALGVAVVGRDGYEADDVLATLSRQAERAGRRVLVVTGDRDLFQLASDLTSVIYIGRGVAKHELADAAWVQQKYGVPATHYVDFAVLRGDPSDGLPGVAGIGEKSAAQLVQKYGDIDAMVAAASDPASGMSASLRKRLHDALDYLAVAREVVATVDDLDLPMDAGGPALRARRPDPDDDRLATLSTTWNLGGSMTRIIEALGSVGA